eukprot:TRINITY_DN2657_c0_g3_i4.p1 TRINITY_DN2657_c0_g3~~TRINITY_DN2657_c0_g3_i4.p1  ORF type:complete len:670 (-),score=246.60 TRINITY_DN2657_c0_g3_i4:30-2039(-)
MNNPHQNPRNPPGIPQLFPNQQHGPSAPPMGQDLGVNHSSSQQQQPMPPFLPPYPHLYPNNNYHYYPPPPQMMFPHSLPQQMGVAPPPIHLTHPSYHHPFPPPHMVQPQMPLSINSHGNDGNHPQNGSQNPQQNDPEKLKAIENYIVSLLHGGNSQANSDPEVHSLHSRQQKEAPPPPAGQKNNNRQKNSSSPSISLDQNDKSNAKNTNNNNKKASENLNQKQKQPRKPFKKNKPEKVYQEKQQPSPSPPLPTIEPSNEITIKVEGSEITVIPTEEEVKHELSALQEGVAEHALNPQEVQTENAENRVEEIKEKKERPIWKSKPSPFNSNDYVSLSSDMIKLYNVLQPSEGEYQKRIKIVNRLQKIIQTKWPESGASLHLFGSSANMFGLKDADMDISLVINEEPMGGAKRIVIQLGNLLKKKKAGKDVLSLPRARVPIVKFTEELSNISCDICINNLLAIHNTRLLSTYSKIDPRVRQLGYIVKYWAKMRKINEPYQGSLSSYAYILMVIHFLQLRSPPILPVLQEMTELGEERKENQVEGFDVYFYSNLDKLKDFGKENTESIGELLACFYKHYAVDFDWDESVISVRTGLMLTKEEKDWTKATDKKNNVLFALEDPFETTHNLGRLVDAANLKVIKYEFNRAYKLSLNLAPLGSLCEQYQYKQEEA